MFATGIVAEYNPFHNGHAYQVKKIKQTLKPDVIIAVMSGNFLQRGEPAIVDKWTRTQMALSGGVDLVIELPVLYSTQSADYFAKGAIRIMELMNVNSLSFGVEVGDSEEFLDAATWLIKNEKSIYQRIKHSKIPNAPYAKQMEETINALNPNFPLHINSPNNQLGFAYTKEIVKNDLINEIEIFPIKRKDSNYNDQQLSGNSNIASATAIRQALHKQKTVETFVPSSSFPYLECKNKQYVSWEDYFPLLKYQIMVSSVYELKEIYEMNEGLENRLKEKIKESNNFKEFIDKIKTKRYTQTRLQRLLVYTLLQITRRDVADYLKTTPEIRVLGFNQTGQQYLSLQKNKLESRFISNVNQKTKNRIPFEVLAGEIYQLGDKSIQKQDFMRKPINLFDRSPEY